MPKPNVDFSKISGPNGRKVVSAYHNDYNYTEYSLCKLDNGNWAFYRNDAARWYSQAGQYEFTTEELGTKWDSTIKAGPFWPSQANAPKSKEAPCVCSSIDIFNYGCPAARGLKCRSMK